MHHVGGRKHWEKTETRESESFQGENRKSARNRENESRSEAL